MTIAVSETGAAKLVFRRLRESTLTISDGDSESSSDPASYIESLHSNSSAFARLREMRGSFENERGCNEIV